MRLHIMAYNDDLLCFDLGDEVEEAGFFDFYVCYLIFDSSF